MEGLAIEHILLPTLVLAAVVYGISAISWESIP